MQRMSWGLLALASANALAADLPREAAAFVPDGMALQAQLAADLTGDGLPDLAFIAGNDEQRVVQVQDGAEHGLKPGDFVEVTIMGSDEHDLYGLVAI